jgi:cobalamin biosynthesis Mg chelatase CobN
MTFIMIVVIGSGIAVAHPGHGEEYPPEEVTDDNSGQSNQNSGTTKNTKKTTSSNKNTGSGDSSSDSTSQSTDSGSSDTDFANNYSNSTGVEEVSDNQTNSTSTSSDTPWNIAAMVGVFVIGFGGMVLIFKLGHFGRFSQ